MKQSEIDRAVARTTGESRRTIAHYGFQIDSNQIEASIEPLFGLDCPGCGHAVSVSTDQFEHGQPEAECLVCDLYYPFETSELKVIDSQEAFLQSA